MKRYSLTSTIHGCLLICCSMMQAEDWKFHFTDGLVQPGYARVTNDAAFDEKVGYGFLPVETMLDENKPRLFSLNASEGTYEVTVLLGHAKEPTCTTLKAESRRLMMEEVETKPGEFINRSFMVNVRRPEISHGRSVSLKETEKLAPNWDEQLSFEITGSRPGLMFLQIKPAKAVTTIYITGDSTVTDQHSEPYTGWGQMLPRFFGPEISIANHAWSGLALFSFQGGKRLEKILSQMNKGDYLFVQFGHNDQKDKSKEAGPFNRYKKNLKEFVLAAREKGGIPVLVTPMERRRFDKDGRQGTTLGDYAAAVRQVGGEENVPVIDLHAMSLKFYAALGPEKSKAAFVYYPANTFPGRAEAMKDDTHHSSYGGYELARCMVEGIKTAVPELAKYLAADVGEFDPSKPDAPDHFSLPKSPVKGGSEKPEGS